MADWDASTKRVMVVDDERPYCEAVGEILRAAGFRVRQACSAEAARSILESWIPDIILLDLRMPGEDGLTLMRRLMVRSELSGAKFVIVSAHVLAMDECALRDAGAEMFLPKPFNSGQLLDAVGRLLNRERPPALP